VKESISKKPTEDISHRRCCPEKAEAERKLMMLVKVR
jgi:hypothetical protein